MRLMDHVTLNFNNNMSKARYSWILKKPLNLGLLYKLSNLKFLISLIKFISSFLSHRKFSLSQRWNVCAKGYTSRDATKFHPVPHIIQYSTPGVYLGLFADDTHIYATDRKESYVLRKLQRGLSAIEMWCESWNIKINEIRLRSSIFLINLGPLRLIIHWMDRISPSSVMLNIWV
jgi:hypothetical protein